MHLDALIQNKIEKIGSLPTLPDIVVRLMQTVNNPTVSSSDIADLISRDISLSAKILRLANSAFYGMPKTITTLNSAIVLLGLRVIATIVLSLTVFDIFPRDRKSTLFNRKAFWYHSIMTGSIAKLIAQRSDSTLHIDPDEAFCAGLLHDIGKIVMEQYFHDDLHAVMGRFVNGTKPLVIVEQEILLFTHADIGRHLTMHWQLPGELFTAIANHHEPMAEGVVDPLTALCHVADRLFYDLELDAQVPPAPAKPPLDTHAFEMIGLSDDEIESLKNSLKIEQMKVEAFYSIAQS